MENLESKPKRKPGNQLRIAIKSEEVRALLVHWADQIKGHRKGIKPKFCDLIEYILSSHPKDLSNSEIREYQEHYVSEVDLAKWALRELVAAEGRGEKLSLLDVLSNAKSKNLSEKKAAKENSRSMVDAARVAASDRIDFPNKENYDAVS